MTRAKGGSGESGRTPQQSRLSMCALLCICVCCPPLPRRFWRADASLARTPRLTDPFPTRARARDGVDRLRSCALRCARTRALPPSFGLTCICTCACPPVCLARSSPVRSRTQTLVPMVAYREAVHSAILAAVNPRAKKGVGINKIREGVGEQGLNSKSHIVSNILKEDVANGILFKPTGGSWRFHSGKAPK